MLASSPSARRGGAGAASSRSAAPQATTAAAATGAAAQARPYNPPAGIDDLLGGYGLVGGGGGDGDGTDADELAGADGGQDDDNAKPSGGDGDGAGLDATRRPPPASPDRDAHIRLRVAQTPEGHSNLRHMPTLRAALGKESLSFNEVARLSHAPPGHAIPVPQSPGGGLSLALRVDAEAARLMPDSDVRLVRSVRPEDRLRALSDILPNLLERSARDEHERQTQAAAQADAAGGEADLMQQPRFTPAPRTQAGDTDA